MIELIVTLVLVAIVSTAVLQLRHSTTRQSRSIRSRMAKLTSINNCFDKLTDDVIISALAKGKMTVETKTDGGLETSKLTIIIGQDKKLNRQNQSIDWVATKQYERDDLVLYRRETIGKEDQNALYIPLCENLYSFRVELLNEEAMEGDPNQPPAILQIHADLFRSESKNPEELITVNKTFCLRRFW